MAIEMTHFQYLRFVLQQSRRRTENGFTLLEVLVVVLFAAILATIAAPAWGRFLANQRVAKAQNEVRLAIQKAQATAIANQSAWRFSLREQGDHLEWAVHADDQRWQDVTVWQALDTQIILEATDTTLAQKSGVYYVRFGFQGEVLYRLSTISLTSENGLAQARCVVISTLIGATRNGKEHLYPNGNGRYCY